METRDVVNFLLKKGFQVTPEAAESLKNMTRLEFQDLVKTIIRDKNRKNDDNFMVSLDDVRNNIIQESVQDEVSIDEIRDVAILLGAPGKESGTVHFTIGMPGHLLDTGSVDLVDGWTKVLYKPLVLKEKFPNIDISGRISNKPGLADTVWINVLVETTDGGFYARQFTLQGPDLIVPIIDGEQR